MNYPAMIGNTAINEEIAGFAAQIAAAAEARLGKNEDLPQGFFEDVYEALGGEIVRDACPDHISPELWEFAEECATRICEAADAGSEAYWLVPQIRNALLGLNQNMESFPDSSPAPVNGAGDESEPLSAPAPRRIGRPRGSKDKAPRARKSGKKDAKTAGSRQSSQPGNEKGPSSRLIRAEERKAYSNDPFISGEGETPEENVVMLRQKPKTGQTKQPETKKAKPRGRRRQRVVVFGPAAQEKGGKKAQPQTSEFAASQSTSGQAQSSIQTFHLQCLECGAEVVDMAAHLLEAHRLSPALYREAYGLPEIYPMFPPGPASKRGRVRWIRELKEKSANLAG